MMDNNFSLNIPLYAKGTGTEVAVDNRTLHERYAAWENASKKLHEQYGILNALLGEVGESDV